MAAKRPARAPAASTQAALQLGLFEDPLPTTRAGALAPGAPGRLVQLPGAVLGYVLKRGKRRTIGFTIDDAGLTIAAPRWVSIAEIESAIRDKGRWIEAKLTEWNARRAQMPTLTWAHGAMLPLLGAQLALTLVPDARAAAQDGDRLVLPLPHDATPDQIRDRAQGYMQQRARALFAERLAVYCARLDMDVGRWALSSARTRWGSCTSDGTIRLNWRLLHFPMSVVDYVVAHEVAHRRELNHGPRFWRTVESIFPEFREAEELLKFHSPGMLEAE